MDTLAFSRILGLSRPSQKIGKNFKQFSTFIIISICCLFGGAAVAGTASFSLILDLKRGDELLLVEGVIRIEKAELVFIRPYDEGTTFIRKGYKEATVSFDLFGATRGSPVRSLSEYSDEEWRKLIDRQKKMTSPWFYLSGDFCESPNDAHLTPKNIEVSVSLTFNGVDKSTVKLSLRQSDFVMKCVEQQS